MGRMPLFSIFTAAWYLLLSDQVMDSLSVALVQVELYLENSLDPVVCPCVGQTRKQGCARKLVL